MYRKFELWRSEEEEFLGFIVRTVREDCGWSQNYLSEQFEMLCISKLRWSICYSALYRSLLQIKVKIMMMFQLFPLVILL